MELSTLSPELERNKSEMENELLIKLGVKKEEFDWHPDIIDRKSERPKSSIHIEYPLDIKVGRPKNNTTEQNRNPWYCNNQALRQMTMVSRHGPRSLYFNKHRTMSNTVNILRI
ncbi:uncharacterized protein LOC127710279 [Mytilus californianus]|uniref:uncharacterized protein LOC127710279 n=1 Tax=Mytilus californianus TaxID=6549 RepID=UPI002245503F|nr:uncharacterized protein LOC127710279 [Mytilus californianus]XP_052072022.1 uncharacterized protein LOC127710279 [Mytilus californianus]